MSEYHIQHITRYSYPSPVIDSANQVMLFPIDTPHQQVKDHKLMITHQPSVEIFHDYFGNKIGVFTLIRPHTELVIESKIHVALQPIEFVESTESTHTQWAQFIALKDQFPFMDFLQLENTPITHTIESLVATYRDTGKSPFSIVQQMSAFVYQHFEYKKGITNVETSVDEIWKLHAGVCQDFAHVLLVMLRLSGIPSRYVSGYICPKGQELRGEGATHAWVEAYLPFFGWMGFDPTNNCIASDQHVRLAVGRNFSDCTPVKGTYKGSSAHTLEVSVVINNGLHHETEEAAAPVFTYQVSSESEPVASNSYRRFIEMQQQQ